MEKISFNFDSLRSQKARLTVGISKTWRFLLKIGSFMSIISGVVILVTGIIYGWLLIAIGIVFVMVYQWWRYALYRLPIDEKSNTIDGLMSSSVLGRLPKNPSPRQIADILPRTSSGLFLTIRFGLGAKFFQQLASENSDHIDEIWESAKQIRQQTNSKTISGGVLALAILKSFPAYESLLGRLQLDFGDLIDGVRWHDYMHSVHEQELQPRYTGGIARDWSFGYVPLLDRFGINISNQLLGKRLISAELPSYKQIIGQMFDIFSGAGRQNAVLVGDAGVGKTTLVYSFADKLLDSKANISSRLKYNQVYLLDAATLVAAAPGRGELESLVYQIMNEAHNAQNIILCLDNADVFFEEGTGKVDLSSVLLPIIEGGAVRIILTIDNHKMLQLAQKNPSLANAFNKIMVPELNKEETLAVMKDRIVPMENRNGVVFMYQAMEEAYNLSSRYIYDLSMPGKAIKLLESAIGLNQGGLITNDTIRQTVEKTMNVKISKADTQDEREKLLNLESLIHKRMINQTRAVNVVSNALRRARAGVRNQNRPIGTFLFLGPTGVGKTELAKALSEVYFDGENNLVRIDLNEYVTINDVARLIADGATNPNSLTAQVMKKPFSVILMDEIEKAHPAVLTTLLQVLDEGILRDEKGREVSFRDAIIIATSNAGAERIREYIERGYQLETFEKQIVNELISSNQFRSEFLNRFDEIVVFRSLNKEELMQVMDLILNGINKTLENQKISVNVSDEAKKHLIEIGYDPRLGARPIRRVVQATVENIIAKKMIELGNEMSGQIINIELDDIKTILLER